MRESKSQLTDRLRREGRFDDFKRRREELKAEGIPAKYAWYQAAVEFPREHLTPAAEPLIPWSKAGHIVKAAKDDLEWLLRALPVQIPPRVAASNPKLHAILLALRSDPALRSQFHSLVLARLAKPPADGPPGRLLTMDELLGSSKRRRYGVRTG
jgi:hypothetical protein